MTHVARRRPAHHAVPDIQHSIGLLLVPSCVADQESVTRYFHADLPDLDGAVLAHELRLSEAALATIPRRYFIDREWWAGRRAAVLAELACRAPKGTFPDPSEGTPRKIIVEVE